MRGDILRSVCSWLKERAGVGEVVQMLPRQPNFVLAFNDVTPMSLRGVSFVPAHPDIILVTLMEINQVRAYNFKKGLLLCTIGRTDWRPGNGEYEFLNPLQVAVSESSCIVVADSGNNRVQVFQLVLAENESTATATFVSTLADTRLDHFYRGAKVLNCPKDVVLRMQNGKEVVRVADSGNDRVCDFWLDGTIESIMDGNSGVDDPPYQFSCPSAMAMLPGGGMAMANSKLGSGRQIQVFTAKHYEMFGMDFKFSHEFDSAKTNGLAADEYGNLLTADMKSLIVYTSKAGKRIAQRARSDLGVKMAIHAAWRPAPAPVGLAVVDVRAGRVLVWAAGPGAEGAGGTGAAPS
jgi:hypothetical protein